MKLAILMALGAATVHGAAVFKGKLVRNEIGGMPVPGASVRAPGANPTVSRNPQGDFVLEFPAKNPGDLVTLSVAMKGMVVVNWVQLGLVLPADPDANKLTLILALKADQEEMARRFFRLKSIEAIEANYRHLIEEGKQDRSQLQKQLEQAKAAAASATDELAKLRPGQASPLYEDAMRFFAVGKIDEALQALDEAKLRRLSQEAQERKEQAEKQLAEATRTWLLRGKLLTTKFRFADAEAAYGEAVQASPGDFNACSEQAYFFAILHRYTPAVQGYVRCLALARANADLARVATTLNNLGALHRDQNRMEEARKAFEEALEIRRQLARTTPGTYLPDVAGTLNNLGVLHRDQNRMEEARKAFEEALDTYRQLARTTPGTYLPDVAGTLNNLGVLHRDQNRVEEARKAYEEVLDTYRQLARTTPDTYLPYVAIALNNLGVLDGQQNRMEEARKALQEALDIRRQLASANPDTYLPDVAQALNNLGMLHRQQKRVDAARKTFEEALEIRRRLAHADPDTYLPYVATTLNNLGLLDTDQNRMEEALKAYEEALEIRRQLARANPDTYLPYVARVLRNLGSVYVTLHQDSEARQALEEALGIYKKFAAKDRAQYQPLVDAVSADLARVGQ
jgi:tetratricopeptide (TPR) repeat protein